MIGVNRVLRKLPGNRYNQRWGINTTMTLTDPDGIVYLFRRRLIQTPWAAIYLHDILTPDSDPAPHSHPFAFASLVLRGGYIEEVHHPGPRCEDGLIQAWPPSYVLGPASRFYRPRGRMHTFPRGNGQVHVIVDVLPRTKTLVFAGRRKDSWGFWSDRLGAIQHWSEYLVEQGREPTGTRRVNP